MNTRLLNAFLYRLVLISLALMCDRMSGCSVDMCSREYSSVVLMSSQAQSSSQTLMRASVRPDHYCSLLNAYNHCIRSIARSCRGNLEFHTIQTLLKNWKNHYNCTGNKYKPVTPIQRKSGAENSQSHHNNNHNWNGHQSPHAKHSSSEDHLMSPHQQQRRQYCLSAAYNYTIYRNNDTQFSPPRDERIKLLVSEFSESDISDRTDSNNRHNLSVSYARKRHNQKKSRKHRNTADTDTDSVPVRAMKGLPLDDEEGDDNEDSDDEDMDNSGDSIDSVSSITDFDSSSKVQSSSSSSSNSPSISLTPHTPPSPPLTCIIYGDPHLRTFYSHYQTCKVLGAWPLIEHPLFAVQITNSRIKGMNQQITGVTKVTVLVRQFSKCGIFSDLLYEADTANTEGGVPTLSSTFSTGSSSTSNNLIRITTHNNKVVTIHLDHIGVRVYIGQFASLNYLNVVIKFRSATSAVKQQLVLNSISENSLCKAGCPKRELIDIRDILRATNVNIDDISDFDAKQKQPEASKDREAAIDSETSRGDQQTVEEPCHALVGYYRISCLYDLTIKGVTDVSNACRFAQSFDEMKSSVELSGSEQQQVAVDGNHITVQSSKSCSNVLSINIFLVIVIFLFCSYNY